MQRFQSLNERYEAKHGFCFILVVVGKSAEEVLGHMERRIQSPTEDEIAIARAQIVKLVGLRLAKLVSD
jgi:2-oxo-4-hydroxy-4-carboxy--5-ureidoimidazoline (OHCU) decarboxylase